MSAASSASPLPTRHLGTKGPEVSAIGYGAMGLSGVYGPADDAESTELLRHLLDTGLTFLDTADVYGDGHNERLIARAIAGRRDEVFLATKFGAGSDTGRGRPEYVRTAIEASLGRLETDRVDLYYLHRVDPTTPIEDTVGALGELVQEGKVRHIGLSEVSAETLRRAHATYPVTAVQQEYSLFTREPETRLLPTLRELGVGLVAYSPLGRGVLGGGIRDAEQVENLQQRRQRYPRFSEENLRRNLTLVERLRQRAEELGRTPAQLALGWLLAQGEDVVPIPGSRKLGNVMANVEAARRPLEDSVVAELAELFPVGAAAGDRYAPELSARLEQ
ncbi:aryl-alcohol dehydrogenase-like predicted oxidoreductase [Halopolyspora algeriensis]|uniref:Aryl-alcohol dehydrogenase-like predicted oxidoreductase n=1 Tax=Halopolyspora algeriensis TaxID=1500506 RepID=A0A368VVV7_9ACTN|nr:aldo/keto reductase [Halopolyspora algeriensis]RCW45979.1 aryl-alcohol dehydrogenase-like predicted oxidoreductase [Halopolyspora algeriensis]TQM55392.1 aryl-alcohol dehydrogenase-like predicted oxidoreductase [Halopolyspora algeriensis]